MSPDGPHTGVHAELVGATLLIRFSDPRARNALTPDHQAALAAAVETASSDPSVRAVVLTGTESCFASGGDIGDLSTLQPTRLLEPESQVMWRALAECGKPVVAAVSGYALGGGCELALACDLVVAADTAVFGQPEVRLGLNPGAGGVQRWARLVGRLQAAEVLMTGDRVDVWTARRLGIVARVVPAPCLVESALEYAGRLGQHAPLALDAIKSGLRASDEAGLTQALQHDVLRTVALLGTEDAAEGAAAFFEKRAPDFRGR